MRFYECGEKITNIESKASVLRAPWTAAQHQENPSFFSLLGYTKKGCSEKITCPH